jgi:hypothetical protein
MKTPGRTAGSNRWRWLYWVAGGILLLALVAYFGIGYYVYDLFTTVHPGCGSVYMEDRREFTPASFKGIYYPENNTDVQSYLVKDFQTVEFPARVDNNTISAWFIPSTTPSDRAVIVVHGADMCRRNTNVLLPAGMLANNGFNVLSIDLRSHGDSQVVGSRLTAGVTEYRDVLGAFDWLRNKGYAAGKIGVLGVSMGGATAINAFGEEPTISAIWSDSAYADIPTVLKDQLALNGMPLFLSDAVLIVARLNGTNLDMDVVSPIRSIQKFNGRPVAIVHGSKDDWVNVNSAYRLYNATGKTADLWVTDGTRHVEGMFVYPGEYEKRLIAFFSKALGK